MILEIIVIVLAVIASLLLLLMAIGSTVRARKK